MIRVDRAQEPPQFDLNARQPGLIWLAANPTGRPRDYWTPFQPDLAQAFHNRCGYRAMWDPDGTVDHYLSCENRRDLAYEWDNYRYVSGSVNSSKRNLDDQVLDPFEVFDDWFEISLPSFQLVLTDRIPANIRTKAQFTLERLKLRNGHKVRKARRLYYELYKDGRLSIEGLRVFAPQVARAVERAIDSGRALP
jgi:hypothetical protein